MKRKYFRVFDSENNYLRTFDSYIKASTYIIYAGRFDWKIKTFFK